MKFNSLHNSITISKSAILFLFLRAGTTAKHIDKLICGSIPLSSRKHHEDSFNTMCVWVETLLMNDLFKTRPEPLLLPKPLEMDHTLVCSQLEISYGHMSIHKNWSIILSCKRNTITRQYSILCLSFERYEYIKCNKELKLT